MDTVKQILLASIFILLLPLAVHADGDDFESDDYMSFAGEARGDNDPFEGLNRSIHDFNQVIDGLVLEPVSELYSTILPQFAQNRIYDFLENIESPVIFINSVLQADPENVFVTFWRFVFNTTLGVGGLFDVATELGMPERNHEDFGQTLGVWGVGTGPYLVLPLLGPSSLRDAPGIVVDILVNPFTYALKSSESIALAVTDAVDTRARLDRFIDQVNDSSLDSYSTFRSLYLQRRKGLINNFAQ